MCNYSDAYIVVKGRISVTGNENANRKNKNQLSRIMLCLDHVYQKSVTHLKEIQKILNHYRDRAYGSTNEIGNNDNMKNKNKIMTKKSFNYKTKIIQSTFI